MTTRLTPEEIAAVENALAKCADESIHADMRTTWQILLLELVESQGPTLLAMARRSLEQDAEIAAHEDEIATLKALVAEWAPIVEAVGMARNVNDVEFFAIAMQRFDGLDRADRPAGSTPSPPPCQKCGGTGEVLDGCPSGDCWTRCPDCSGTGKAPGEGGHG